MDFDIYKEINREYTSKRENEDLEIKNKKRLLEEKLPKYKTLEDKKNEIAISYAREILTKSGMEKEIVEEDQKRVDRWEDKLRQLDKGLNDVNGPWYEHVEDLSEWKVIHVPSEWNTQELKIAAGVVWFRKEIELTEAMLHQKTPPQGAFPAGGACIQTGITYRGRCEYPPPHPRCDRAPYP